MPCEKFHRTSGIISYSINFAKKAEKNYTTLLCASCVCVCSWSGCDFAFFSRLVLLSKWFFLVVCLHKLAKLCRMPCSLWWSIRKASAKALDKFVLESQYFVNAIRSVHSLMFAIEYFEKLPWNYILWDQTGYKTRTHTTITTKKWKKYRRRKYPLRDVRIIFSTTNTDYPTEP